MTLGVRTLVQVLNTLAENNCNIELCNLFTEAENSTQAYLYVNTKTKNILDDNTTTI
jgi:hypothetical protein